MEVWSALRLGHFSSGENVLGTHLTGSWMNPIARLFEGENIFSLAMNRIAITKDGSLSSHGAGRSGPIGDSKVVLLKCLIKHCAA
jgi:hypothetical protein